MKTSSIPIKMGRRSFLQAAAAGVTVTALPLSLVAPASAQSSNRSLVCVFLAGGADSFNMFIPRDHDVVNQTYATYAASRGSFAVPANQLLPINDGAFGLHPSLRGMAAIAEQNKLAVVQNVGPLSRLTSKSDYRSGRNLPQSLFAHDAQQKLWQTARPTLTTDEGWGSAIQRSVANGGGTPPSFSLNGSNIWQTSGSTGYARLSPTVRVKRLYGYDKSLRSWIPSFAGVEAVMNQSILDSGRSSNILDLAASQVLQQSILTTAALERATASSAENDVGMDDVGGNKLGQQLKMVARLIKNREALGMPRQMFFARMGGWDTHRNQQPLLPILLQELDTALSSFQASLAGQGVESSVTTFTASDFGRTLTINGDGTDHGWGGHTFVVGGAVNAGRYGTFPSYATANNADDVGDRSDNFAGRLIPTTSVTQHGATLAKWMGLNDAQLAAAFPELSNFEHTDLGFL